MKIGSRCVALALGVFVAVLGSKPAPAAEEDFYKGKVITIVCSTEPGAVYDIYSRILGRYMSAHIPGRPTIVIQNMPGAGGIKATNYIYNVALKDGTVFAGPHSGVPTAPLTNPNSTRFDVNKLSWIGSATKDPLVAYVWHTSPVQSLEEAKTKELLLGGTGAGTASVDIAKVATALLGLKIKLVPGYKSAVDVKLAMERGEVSGTFGHSWHGLKTTNDDWIKEGKVHIIAQHGLTRHPDLPDVPLLLDFAQTEADRQALVFMVAMRQEVGKPYIAPLGVPSERLQILRRAFDATMKDPGFLEEAQKAKIPIDGPMTGEDLAKLVSTVSATPPEVVNRVLNILKN